MENDTADAVLCWVDGVVEETEEGLFVFLDELVVAELERGVRDLFCLKFVHSAAEVDPYLWKFLHLAVFLELFHKAFNLAEFVAWGEDGRLTDAFSPILVKIIGDTCHQTELGQQVGWPGVSTVDLLSPDLVLCLKQRLVLIFDIYVVFLFVVVFECGALLANSHLHHWFEGDIYNPVKCAFSIVGHNNRIHQSFLDFISFLLLIFVLVLLVECVDGV